MTKNSKLKKKIKTKQKKIKIKYIEIQRFRIEKFQGVENLENSGQKNSKIQK
jgi:hypothetical protein